MDKEIVMQLIELVKAGGTAAVWLIILYQVMAVLKAIIVPAAWVLCVRYIAQGFYELLKWGAEKSVR